MLDFVLGTPAVVASEGAGEQVASSIAAIGDAVLLGAASGAPNASVVLSTANLNITAEKRPPAQIAEKPAVCQTETEPATVELPPDVLSSLAGVADASQPIDLVFFSSAVNLHGPPPRVGAKDAADGSPAASAPNVTLASPLISFSLRQSGKELRVSGTNHPITIAVPLRKGTNTSDKCIGQPANASAAGCRSALECRWWDEGSEAWKGDGCRTKEGSAGSVVCECDHLTDFVVFEFPTSWEDLGADLLSGFQFNGLSLEAFQCFARPSISETPFLWTVNAIMLGLAAFALWRATEQDRIQIDTIQMLVQGRVRERERRLKRAVMAFQGAAQGFQARGSKPRGSESDARSSAVVAARRLTEALGAFKQPLAGVDSGEKPQVVPARAIRVPVDAVDVAGETVHSSEGDAVSLCISPHELDYACDVVTGARHTRRLSVPACLMQHTASELPAEPAAEQPEDVALEAQPGGAHGDKCADMCSRGEPTRLPSRLRDKVQQQLARSSSETHWSPRRALASLVRSGSSQAHALQKQPFPMERGGGLYKSVSDWERARTSGADEGARLWQEEDEDASRVEGSGEESEEGVGKEDSEGVGKEDSDGVGEEDSEGVGKEDSDGQEAVSVREEAGTHVIDVDGAPQLYTSLSTWLEAGEAWPQPSTPRQPIDAKELWASARRRSQHAVLAQRWHKDVDRRWKAIWLDFKLSHTFLAAMFYRGSPGLTRAQTCHILLNSLALELVILCMMYSSPDDGPVVINPIRIISSGCVAALLCMPAMILFSWCFAPRAFVRFGRLILLLPIRVLGLIWSACCTRLCAPARGRAPRGMPSPPLSPPPSPPTWPAPAALPPPSILPSSSPGKPMTLPPPLSAQSTGQPTPHVAQGVAVGATKHAAKWRAAAAQNVVLQAPAQPLHRPRALGADRRGAVADAKFSYASLDEHLLQLSLRHALRRRDFRCAASIVGMWSLSWLVFAGLMLTFSLYGCQFHLQRTGATNQEELLLSWGWSVGQRFLINEPALILLAKGLPLLFTSKACARFSPCWTESCGELFAMTIDVLINVFRSLTA